MRIGLGIGVGACYMAGRCIVSNVPRCLSWIPIKGTERVVMGVLGWFPSKVNQIIPKGHLLKIPCSHILPSESLWIRGVHPPQPHRHESPCVLYNKFQYSIAILQGILSCYFSTELRSVVTKGNGNDNFKRLYLSRYFLLVFEEVDHHAGLLVKKCVGFCKKAKTYSYS